MYRGQGALFRFLPLALSRTSSIALQFRLPHHLNPFTDVILHSPPSPALFCHLSPFLLRFSLVETLQGRALEHAKWSPVSALGFEYDPYNKLKHTDLWFEVGTDPKDEWPVSENGKVRSRSLPSFPYRTRSAYADENIAADGTVREEAGGQRAVQLPRATLAVLLRRRVGRSAQAGGHRRQGTLHLSLPFTPTSAPAVLTLFLSSPPLSTLVPLAPFALPRLASSGSRRPDPPTRSTPSRSQRTYRARPTTSAAARRHGWRFRARRVRRTAWRRRLQRRLRRRRSVRWSAATAASWGCGRVRRIRWRSYTSSWRRGCVQRVQAASAAELWCQSAVSGRRRSGAVRCRRRRSAGGRGQDAGVPVEWRAAAGWTAAGRRRSGVGRRMVVLLLVCFCKPVRT